MLHLNGFGWLVHGAPQISDQKETRLQGSSPDRARDEIWARWAVRARRKVERCKSGRHECVHGCACECDAGTATTAEAKDECVRVERSLSVAHEAGGAERKRVLVYLWVIRDLPDWIRVFNFKGKREMI